MPDAPNYSPDYKGAQPTLKSNESLDELVQSHVDRRLARERQAFIDQAAIAIMAGFCSSVETQQGQAKDVAACFVRAESLWEERERRRQR